MQLVEKLRSNFAKNLTKLREQKQLTQEGLANAINERYHLGLKRTSIANYESQAQEAMPKIEALYCLADFFGKTIDQLVQRDLDERTLLPPWMVNDTGTAAANSESSEVLFAENVQSINKLIKDCSEQISDNHFYVEVLRKLLEQFKSHASDEQERQHIAALFRKTYLGCLIEKSQTIQHKAQTLLTEKEYAVWMGFQAGSAVETLTQMLETSETDILNTFVSAKEKLAFSISQITA